MPSRVLSLAAPLVAVFAFAACSSDSSTTAPPSSSSEPTTTTDHDIDHDCADDHDGPDRPGRQRLRAAAGTFVNCWRNGDQAAGAAIAVPAAVQTVFAAGEPGQVEDRGCNTPPVHGPVLCVYRTAAGELQVRVQPRPDGWFVDQAIVSPA